MKFPKMATKEDMEFLETDYDRISHSMHHDGRGNLMSYMTARMAGISPRGANAMVNTFTGDASESGGNGKRFTPYLLELFIAHMHKELMLGEFSTYSNGRGVPDEPEEGNDSHKNNGGENERPNSKDGYAPASQDGRRRTCSRRPDVPVHRHHRPNYIL